MELFSTIQFLPVGVHELQQLYEMWGSSEHAQITKEQFSDGLHQIGVTDPLIIEQSFSAFDEGKKQQPIPLTKSVRQKWNHRLS